MSEVTVLFEGYSRMHSEDQMEANCSCTLITGHHNIIVDTMTAWDSEKILNALSEQKLSPENINYVVSTHGHSDHIGNNNLFLKAKHIVGFSVSFKDKYDLHPFDKGQELIINADVKVIPTPGHTLSDVTVLVTDRFGQKIAITGDLFENFEDITDSTIWVDAGSEDEKQQTLNRSKIADLADWIIPGHGKIFEVTVNIRGILRRQVRSRIRSSRDSV